MILLFKQLFLTLLLAFLAICSFAGYRQLFGGDIIFFEAVLFGVLFFGLCLTGCLIATACRLRCSALQAIFISLAPAFLAYSLFVSLVPTIIDRSVSVTVLGKLALEGSQGATEDDLQQHFLSLYVSGGKAVRVRLNEQLRSGNVEATAGRYQITPRGERVVGILKRIGEAFKIDMAYVSAQQTRD